MLAPGASQLPVHSGTLCCAGMCSPASYSAGVSSEKTCIGVVGLSAVVIPWALAPHSGHADVTNPDKLQQRGSTATAVAVGVAVTAAAEGSSKTHLGPPVSAVSCRCQHATLMRDVLHHSSAVSDNAFQRRLELFDGS